MERQECSFIKETKATGAVMRFAKAFAIGICFAAAAFLIFSLLICYTPLSESFIPVISLSVTVLSVMLCALYSTKGAKCRGYLRGGLSGLCYAFLLYLISAIYADGFFFNSYAFVLMAIGIFGGAFGGILGINMQDKRRR